MLAQFRKALRTGVVTEPPPPAASLPEELAARVGGEVRRLFGRSLHIRQVDAGSCNGCELEIANLGNPYYDFERFGLHVVASPRHAAYRAAVANGAPRSCIPTCQPRGSPGQSLAGRGGHTPGNGLTAGRTGTGELIDGSRSGAIRVSPQVLRRNPKPPRHPPWGATGGVGWP